MFVDIDRFTIAATSHGDHDQAGARGRCLERGLCKHPYNIPNFEVERHAVPPTPDH